MSRQPEDPHLPPPHALACVRHGLRAGARRPALLLGLAFALAGLESCVAAFGASLLAGFPFGLLASLAMAIFLLAPLHWGLLHVALRAARGAPARAHDALRVLDNYREAVAAQALVFTAVALGAACFVLPGVWIYARTRFVPYLVVEEEMDAAAAIAESVRLTRGRTRAILGISLLGAVLAVGGALAAGVGIVPAFLVWELALASLYHASVLPSDAWEPASPLARPALSF